MYIIKVDDFGSAPPIPLYVDGREKVSLKYIRENNVNKILMNLNNLKNQNLNKICSTL